MKRRQFLQAAGIGAAASAVATPAIAQAAPEIRWRLPSGFPKSLDTLYGAAETFSKLVSEATDGKFQIQAFAAGEIVGTPQAARCGRQRHRRDGPHLLAIIISARTRPSRSAPTCPFGLNSRQMNAWLYHGGGNDLLNEFYAKHNLYAMPGGNTGAQMGGWFRKEIKTVAGSAGPEDAHRRSCRPGHGEARRRAAADRRRRHLSGARARHHRRRRVGRPLRRREARLQ